MIKINIVEDMPVVLEGLKLLVDAIEDFKITDVFENGRQFVNQLDKVDADIVLMDIQMPELNGIEAVKKALERRPELKFIALSMYDDKKHYYEMVTAGARGFCLKSSTTAELETAIRTVHKGGNFFSQDLLRSVIINIQSIEQNIVDTREAFLKLSERDVEMIRLICKGYTNNELAAKLFVSVRTIESAKSRLMAKTDTRNNAGLIIWAVKNKIVII